MRISDWSSDVCSSDLQASFRRVTCEKWAGKGEKQGICGGGGRETTWGLRGCCEGGFGNGFCGLLGLDSSGIWVEFRVGLECWRCACWRERELQAAQYSRKTSRPLGF